MRYESKTTLAALSALFCSAVFCQAQALSVTNYQLVGTQVITSNLSRATYHADLVNLLSAAPSVTATVTSVDPYSIRVVPGQDTLTYAPVPANSHVASADTFTILVAPSVPVDFSKLQWTFQSNAGALTANAGPNQTAKVGALVTLDGSGSINPSGMGTLSYSWRFTSRPLGSSAVLFNNTLVNPMFVVDVAGTYVITLTVSNGGATSSASVTVTTGNSPPVAKAGPNQTVSVGSTVKLDGSGSSDIDGDPLTYGWTLTTKPSGSAAILAGANTVSPTFVVDKPGMYTAQLTVSDGASSSSTTVTITTANTPPVARAGSSQSVNVGTLVHLDGSGSTDVDGNPLTYRWSLLSKPAGSTAVLSNPGIVNPTLKVDLAGTYVAQLIVNDGFVDSAPSTVTITTGTIQAPTANAGPNQTVQQHTVVQLNGSGTDPQGLQLTYLWALLSKPTGSTAVLSSTTIMSPSFSADLPGTYVAQLIVNNGQLNSAPSTVTISTTTCSQPTANPGPNQNVGVGARVTLNGSGSGDACHDPLTYAWSFTTRPAGSAATLSGANSQSPVFVADLAGVYVVQLIVNNGFTSSTPATLTITASGASSAAILLTNATVAPGQSAPFQVTLAAAALSGGVFVMLSSTDTSIVTVAPANIFMPEGATVSNRAPTVTGIGVGSASITATAYGLTPASALVQVGSGSGGGGGGSAMSFSPGTLTINSGATQNLALNLSGPAPAGGLTASLNSNNPSVSTVPLSVTFAAGSTNVSVPVNGVGPGSATITASAPTFGNASAVVTVSSSQNVSVTWYGACWENATIFGYTGNYQAVDFALVTPAPVTVQGTLFFTPNCNASQGMDNMNDFGTLTGSTHMIQGFTHHPDQIPSSAVYWIGPRTADGQCAPGSPCSGCLNYTASTISCSLAP